MSPGALGYRYGAELGLDALIVGAVSMGQVLSQEAIAELRNGAASKFPVTAADLMSDLQGKALGDALKRLEDRWVQSGFTLSRETLLSEG